MEFGNGCIIDEKISKNNYKFSEIKKSLTGFSFLPIEMYQENTVIYNQGLIATCVANSLANGRKYTEKSHDNFSVSFIYANRSTEDTQLEGMIPECALSQMCKYGTVKENQWVTPKKYSALKPYFESDKESLFPLAYPYRASSFYEIENKNFEDIKLALYYNFEVYITVEIFSSFYNSINGLIPDADKKNETNYGAHMMRVVGFDKFGRMKCVNSWGEGWGDKGYCYIPFTNNTILKVYALVDNITERDIKDLFFKVLLKDIKYTTYKQAKIASDNFDMNTKPYFFEEAYYIQFENDFKTRGEAYKYKNNQEIRDRLMIIPVSKKQIFILYYEGYPNSISLFDILIDRNYFGVRDYLKYNKNGTVYIGMKFSTMDEAVLALSQMRKLDLTKYKIDIIEVE